MVLARLIYGRELVRSARVKPTIPSLLKWKSNAAQRDLSRIALDNEAGPGNSEAHMKYVAIPDIVINNADKRCNEKESDNKILIGSRIEKVPGPNKTGTIHVIKMVDVLETTRIFEARIVDHVKQANTRVQYKFLKVAQNYDGTSVTAILTKAPTVKDPLKELFYRLLLA